MKVTKEALDYLEIKYSWQDFDGYDGRVRYAHATLRAYPTKDKTDECYEESDRNSSYSLPSNELITQLSRGVGFRVRPFTMEARMKRSFERVSDAARKQALEWLTKLYGETDNPALVKKLLEKYSTERFTFEDIK